jgi:hypothetical protein
MGVPLGQPQHLPVQHPGPSHLVRSALSPAKAGSDGAAAST